MPSTSRPLATLCLSLTLAGGAIAPMHSAALGLGAIESTTWLGKPLDALIPINAGTDELVDPASELKVSLGSAVDYERLGVDPAAVHRRLLISTEQHNGGTFIRVRTREPLHEPYLDFVLAVRWPQGQLVRGFTIFLDPQPTAAVAATPAAVASMAVTGPTAVPSPVVASARPAVLDLPAGTYETSHGDSLWRIARRWSNGHRVNAAMDAIIDANPEAFVGGNADLLRPGVTLTLPGSQPAVANAAGPAANPDTSVGVAAKLVAQGAAAGSPAVVSPPPRLEVVAAPATPVEVGPENAVYKERVGSINHQVDDLEENLKTSRARLEQMDRELRRLMATYDRQRDGTPTLQTAAMTLPATAGVGSPGLRGAGFGTVGGTLAPQPLAGATRENWPVHVGYWAAIAGLIAWVGWLSWRRQPARAIPVPRPGATPAPLPPGRPVVRQSAPQQAAAAPVSQSPAVEPASTAAQPAKVDRSAVPIGSSMPMSTFDTESVDAGISAGVFIAFGRMSEAEQVLVEALEQQPDRFDLQMQLLDLYLQTENGAAFDRLAESMDEQYAEDEAVLDELSILREAYAASRT